MTNKPAVFNRELSWLEFNARVIDQAARKDIPLLERLRFLTIGASNFDEFFMVRVASLQRDLRASPESRDLAGLTPAAQLEKIAVRAHELVKAQYDILNTQILPELKKQGIEYVPAPEYTSEHKAYLETLFQNEVFPLLTPLRTDVSEGFPTVGNLRPHAAFLLHPLFEQNAMPPQMSAPEGTVPLAVVQLPLGIKRLIYLPSSGKTRQFTVLDDVLRAYGTLLFPGFKADEMIMFRLARGADFAVDEDRDDDFIEAMEEVLISRKSSMPVYLSCSTESPHMVSLLTEKLSLGAEYVYKIDGFADVSALSELLSIEGFDSLKNESWKNYFPPGLDAQMPLWDTLKKRDVLLHVPYESYEPVLNFVSQAADDPQVLAIKMTLYRTGGDSPIVRSLERAARSGKQVTVFVELKARFDEAQNIAWAEQLERAGVIVVYGIANLKVHAKILLVVRRETEGIRRYVHLATGNYNHKTARLYVDMSLFTANAEIANDATVFFNMISGYSALQTMKTLVMAPVNLKSQLLALIEREIQRSTPETPGLIMAKMNSLGHEEIIQALYRANNAGVHVILNVRGICMLVPGVKNQSEHITVISIVDRFLEHTRIFYFQNGGAEELYLSSADWMPRNLDRRVELMFPVMQEDLFKKVKDTLAVLFSDNTHSHYLQKNGRWTPRSPVEKERAYRAQEELYSQFKRAAEMHERDTPREFVIRRR